MSAWRADFTRLKAWQLAFDVGLELYRRASEFPHPHLFTLGAQLQRAAISLSSNISEGYGRRRSKDKAHFYVIAHSSGEEIKNLLFFAKAMSLLNEEAFESLMGRVDEAGRLLHGLIESMGGWHDP